MNMQLTPTQAKLIAEAKARRERLFNPPNARREISATPPAIAKPKPVERQHDAHVIAWQLYRASGASPMRAFVESMVNAEGLDMPLIMSKTRNHAIAHARQRYFYELKAAFPTASLHQIGNVFGGRDHTTVLHGITSHAARHGLPPIYTGYVPQVKVDKPPKPPRPPKEYIEQQSNIAGINWETAAQRWVVRPTINKKRVYGGSFTCLEEAKARLRAMGVPVHARPS